MQYWLLFTINSIHHIWFWLLFMTRYLQNWIQSILISKSDFLVQDLHHPDNIVSVVFGNRPFNPSIELFTVLGTAVSFIDQEFENGPESFYRTNLWCIWWILVLGHKEKSLKGNSTKRVAISHKIMISLKIIFLLNSIYFALQTTYKYVPYINQMKIISRSRRYL